MRLGVALNVFLMVMLQLLVFYIFYQMKECHRHNASTLGPEDSFIASSNPLNRSTSYTQLQRNGTIRPVVLGMATGYRWKQLRNFVTSLRTTQYKGDIILFASKEARWDFELRERLHHYRVKVFFTDTVWPYYEEHTRPHKQAASLKDYMPTIKDMHRRFHLMQMWMTSYGSQYTHGLLSDTRDVVFQLDPFDWSGFTREEVGEAVVSPPPSASASAMNNLHHSSPRKVEPAVIGDRLYAFVENRNLTLTTEPFNKAWMSGAFGEAIVTELGDKNIICSGTTMGSIRALSVYLERMMTLTRGLLSELPRNYFDEFIFDQALHNYVLYKWEKKEKKEKEGDGVQVHFFENGRSPVMALGAVDGFLMAANSSNVTVVNEDGRMPCLVHQYDRFPILLDGWTTVFGYLDSVQSQPVHSFTFVPKPPPADDKEKEKEGKEKEKEREKEKEKEREKEKGK